MVHKNVVSMFGYVKDEKLRIRIYFVPENGGISLKSIPELPSEPCVGYKVQGIFWL